jgi:hypothetical protein
MRYSATVNLPLFVIALISPSLHAGELRTAFRHPADFPLHFVLVIPEKESRIISQKTEGGTETITAFMEDAAQGGMKVEAIDSAGRKVWQHDFGYNYSATPGCSVSISHHPHLPALILGYRGHKWDSQAKLLFIGTDGGHAWVRAYDEKAPEIDAFLRAQPGYSPQRRHSILPVRFSGNDILFECIPGSTGNDPHPLDQELPWYEITVAMDARFHLTAKSVVTTR